MPVQNFIERPAPSAIRFDLEPAINAFESLLLLSKEYEHGGVAAWVLDTLQAMSKEERATNDLVTRGLHYAALPDPGWESFPAYLTFLEHIDPVALRDKMLNVYDSMPVMEGTGPALTIEQAMESANQYLAYLRQRFWSEYVDEPMERQAYLLASDPPTMRRVIVDHLSSMWQKYLAVEWERTRPMLLESVRAFQQVRFQGTDMYDAACQITGRELEAEKWRPIFDNAERVLFVPNAHIGPYVFRVCLEKEDPVILFRARLPDDATIDVPDLSRAEAVTRLSALADDIRLRILRLVAERGELRSQEIMEALALSQPATSRHLSQLAATGYLRERRCDGAKCYSLNTDRINETFQALSNFLLIGERSRK